MIREFCTINSQFPRIFAILCNSVQTVRLESNFPAKEIEAPAFNLAIIAVFTVVEKQ